MTNTSGILLSALQATGEAQTKLFELAQIRRLENFPENQAQVRSVIEVSNVCRQKCKYCIIGANDQKYNYTLDSKSMVLLMRYLYDKGRRTVLLQSGENLQKKLTKIAKEEISLDKIKEAVKVEILFAIDKYVIMPILQEYSVMLRRKLIYTGITRSKKYLYLLGNVNALARGVTLEDTIEKNFTLRERMEKLLY